MKSAHPAENWDEYVSFDMRDGSEIGFSNLFKNWDTYKKIILKRFFKNEIQAYGDSKCNTLDMILEQYAKGDSDPLRPLFTLNGLVIKAEFPYAERGCSSEYVVPYKDLLSYAKPGSVLSRFAD
jgi:hypothetical protein